MTAPPRALALARTIVERLKEMPPGTDVFLEFTNLDSLSPEVVLEVLEPWLGPAPVLAPPLRLSSRAIVEDADVLDLGPVAEAQLRFAGKTWDGVDLVPEERLDGELEGSFAGTLRYQTLVDAEAGAEPLFELVRFHGNCGVVFRAGTVEPVAALADGVVETRDKALRRALEEILVDATPETTTAKAKVRKATKATKASAPKATKAKTTRRSRT